MSQRTRFEHEIELLREAPPPVHTREIVTFPSGETLQVITGQPVGKQEEYWDPTGSRNPLLDTGPAQKDKKLSVNFTVRELTASGGVSADVARIDPKLVECLQRLRDHVGKGVKITSGFRSWKRNRDIYTAGGGKPTRSQHCAGRAADIQIPGMNGLEIGRAAIDAYGPNIGVGLGKNFGHIDVRGVAAAWNYGGAKDSWVSEIKQYQREKGGRQKPSGAPSVERQVGAKPRTELVRFAQRVLNAVQGERLDNDGMLGHLTRGALERFRKRHGLGMGGVLDGPTELALAQRALEELGQQSMFAKFGVLDVMTEQAIAAFKGERGLGYGAALDAATRTALTDALARQRPVVSEPPRTVTPVGTVTNWAQVDLNQRMLHVMELLVNKYQYPVSGAAGLVGNLCAESQVLPNRIEGSKPRTPMRALNFDKVWTDFTAEQVMNRNFKAKQGPLKPGIGLAQWTSSARRAGLFQHTFQGRKEGAAILYSMDAQVDYLVTELESKYSRVNKILRKADISLEDASDEVVYSYEVPGSLLGSPGPDGRRPKLPRDNPAVKEVFVRRREHSRKALRAYRLTHP